MSSLPTLPQGRRENYASSSTAIQHVVLKMTSTRPQKSHLHPQMTEVAPLRRVTDRPDLLVEGWDVVDVIKIEVPLDGVPANPSTWRMMLYAAIIVIFFASHLLRGLAVDHLVVVDPASNHLGWYGWSLLVTALRWQWWIALLLHLRSSGSHAHRWIFLVGLLAVGACFTYTPRYSKLVYGELSASGHQAMMALHTLLSICENASLLFLALVAARRPILLPMLATISALKIFISDLPTPEEPFLREVISSGLPTTVYLILAVGVFIYQGGSDREDLLGVFRLWRSPRSS